MDELRGVTVVGRGGGGATWRFWCNLENGLMLNYLGQIGLTLNHSWGGWFNIKLS